MKQSCDKKEKNRTNIYLKKGKNQKKNKNRKTLQQLEFFLKHLNMKQKREIQYQKNLKIKKKMTKKQNKRQSKRKRKKPYLKNKMRFVFFFQTSNLHLIKQKNKSFS